MSQKRQLRNKIKEEIDAWRQTIQEQDKDAQKYLEGLKKQYDALSHIVLKEQKNIQGELSKYKNLSPKIPLDELGQNQLNSILAFYTALEKSEYQRATEIHKVAHGVIAVSNALDNISTECRNLRHELESAKDPDHKELLNARIQECDGRLMQEISKEKAKALEDFWRNNEYRVNEAIKNVQHRTEHPQLQEYLKRLGELKAEMDELATLYRMEKLEYQKHIEDSLRNIQLLQDSIDRVVPVSAGGYGGAFVGGASGSKYENYPDPSMGEQYLPAMASFLQGMGTQYEKLRKDDYEKCTDGRAREPTPYQKSVGYVMSPKSPSQGLFLFGGVGSGKTCAALFSVAQTMEYFAENPNDNSRSRVAFVMYPNDGLYVNFDKDKNWCGQSILTQRFGLPQKSTIGTGHTHLWTYLLPAGKKFEIYFHCYAYEFKMEKTWGKIFLDKSLVIIDEVQNLVEPSKVGTNSTARNQALRIAQELSKNDTLKKLIMTGTPLLDETRIMDLIKLLNMVKPNALKYKYEGKWNEALAQDYMASSSGQKELAARARQNKKDNEEIFSAYFECVRENDNLVPKAWKPGKREQFQRENLGTMLFVQLEHDVGAYPEIRVTNIPDFNCRPDHICGLTLTTNDAGETYSLNKYATERPLTYQEKQAIAQKDYRHVRTVEIAVPLSNSQLEVYAKELKESKKGALKENCDPATDASRCLNWYSPDNKLGPGSRVTFANYSKKGKSGTDWATKSIALGEVLTMFPKEKHFAVAQLKGYGTGIKDIMEYLSSSAYKNRSHGEAYQTFRMSSIAELLRKNKRETDEKFWTKEVEEWMRRNGKQKRLLYFGKKSDDDLDSRDAFKIFAQTLVNHPENKYGEYVHLFLGDRSAIEGLNLIGFKHAHLLEAMSPGNKQQAIGRLLRFCSHKDIDIAHRYIQIYTYVSKIELTATNAVTKKGQLKANAKVLEGFAMTSDQFFFEGASKDFDPVHELYQALAQTGIDCLLLKDYNQLGYCFPYQPVPSAAIPTFDGQQKQIQDEEERIKELWLQQKKLQKFCMSPQNGQRVPIDQAEYEYMTQLGFEWVEGKFGDEEVCTALGYVIDSSEPYSIDNHIIFLLLQALGNQPVLGKMFDRYWQVRDENAALQYLKGVNGELLTQWNQVRENLERYSKERPDLIHGLNYITLDGEFLIDFRTLPRSGLELKLGTRFPVEQSHILASRLLSLDMSNKRLIIAAARHINPDDASVILSFLLYKQEVLRLTNGAEHQRVLTEGKKKFLADYVEFLEEQNLARVREKLKEKPAAIHEIRSRIKPKVSTVLNQFDAQKVLAEAQMQQQQQRHQQPVRVTRSASVKPMSMDAYSAQPIPPPKATRSRDLSEQSTVIDSAVAKRHKSASATIPYDGPSRYSTRSRSASVKSMEM